MNHLECWKWQCRVLKWPPNIFYKEAYQLWPTQLNPCPLQVVGNLADNRLLFREKIRYHHWSNFITFIRLKNEVIPIECSPSSVALPLTGRINFRGKSRNQSLLGFWSKCIPANLIPGHSHVHVTFIYPLVCPFWKVTASFAYWFLVPKAYMHLTRSVRLNPDFLF